MSISNDLYNKCMCTDHFWPNLLYKIVTRWNRFKNPDKQIRESKDGKYRIMRRPDGTEYTEVKYSMTMQKRRELADWHRMGSTNWRALADQEKKRSRGE